MKVVCIIGSGPAGLMAAEVLSQFQVRVILLEARKSPGWKILVAGSSGLNVTYDSALQEFPNFYGRSAIHIKTSLELFPPEHWLEFLKSLGMNPFLGTSKRFFIREMKGSPLLRAWIKRLHTNGVEFHFDEKFDDFTLEDSGKVSVLTNQRRIVNGVVCALGGASWLKSPTMWPEIFRQKQIQVTPFTPANAGFELVAPPEFFAAAEGLPIKGLTLKTSIGHKQGELMITRYGLEGSPIYWVGHSGPATLDLKPDLSFEKVREKMLTNKKPMERILKYDLKLSEGARLLLQFLGGSSLNAEKIKNLPITLGSPRPLEESISSAGGVSWQELSTNLEVKACPGIYCAGEMIDWSAPTGGFLIQGCVSTGFHAAQSLAQKLNLKRKFEQK